MEEVYPEEFGRLRRIFASRGVGADESADLAQETVTRAILHLRRHGQTATDIRPLLSTIARNLLVERIRGRSPRLVDIEAAEHVADPAPDPGERAETSERAERVHEGLASLAPRHRRVMRLSMSGYGPAEIARELGIKRNAADALLHRARRKLAAAVSAQGPLGLVVVAWAGLRGRARRLANTVASLDPSGGLMSSGASLATVSLAAVIAVSSGGMSTGAGALEGAPSSVSGTERLSVVAPTPPSTETGVSDAGEGTVARPDDTPELGSVEVDVADRSLSARANPHDRSGEDESDIELDIWHKPGDGDDRGITGPLIEESVVRLCGATDMCGEDR